MKGKTSLARFWSWQAGSEANSNHIAFAFYRDGELIKKYSTLEIAGRSGNVLASVSQYLWYRSVRGYGWLQSKTNRRLRYGFCLTTVDRRILCFDPLTGERLQDFEPVVDD
jgi:hypothetical protein